MLISVPGPRVSRQRPLPDRFLGRFTDKIAESGLGIRLKTEDQKIKIVVKSVSSFD
jgi:hypothetical protein